MPLELEKRAIREAFGRASSRYDDVAHVQRAVADRLIAHLPACAPETVLDAGCGTGYATRLLSARFPNAGIVTLDLAAEMVLRAQFSGVCGDIESLPLATASVDLYCSSLAWQWTDLQSAIDEAFRVLSAAGHLQVATLGNDSLHELKDAFAVVDSAPHVRSFGCEEDILSKLHAAGFDNAQVRRERVVTHVSTASALMRELKELGAHVIGPQRRKGLLGRKSWQRVVERYETRRVSGGLPATYDVLYLSATKPRL